MGVAIATAKTPKLLTKKELVKKLGDRDGKRLQHLDLVGTAEAAELLGVERARIGKWRNNGIVLTNGDRIEFPEPISMATTLAQVKRCEHCDTEYETRDASCPECGDTSSELVPDHSKLAATPLWWAEDIRGLADLLAAKWSSRR